MDMAFSTKLFRIVITNQYYKTDHVGDDFDIEPTVSTACWMEQRKIRLLNRAGGVELIWLSQHYDNPLELFKKKAAGVTLSFVMQLKNNKILNLSELEVGYATGQVYYLHNRRSNGSNILHGKAVMGISDLVKRQELAQNVSTPGKDVFAIIDIDLAHWMKQMAQQKNNELFSGFMTYGIKIQNRSTFWRYYLIDQQKRFNGILAIARQEEPSYFGQVVSSPTWPNTYCAESTVPIALYDQYDHIFSLHQLAPSGQGAHPTILLDKLPYPTSESLKKDKVNKKKLYSDIVVYV